MRFIDYNGSGNLDPRDIATGVAVEEPARNEEPDRADCGRTPGQLESNSGCATMTALMALPFLIVLLG